MKTAHECGLDTIDTARSYGNAEKVLGEAGVRGWKVISKLPDVPVGCTDISRWVCNTVDKALSDLRLQSLYGMLVHHSSQLYGDQGMKILTGLRDCQNAGTIERIGVSIYDPSELDSLNPFRLDIVQAPYSVLDRRVETSGWLAQLVRNGVEFHARSVFLQGLLVMAVQDRPPHFDRWHWIWQRWHEWLSDQSLSAVEACISFALNNAAISRIVVGVDSVEHLHEIVAATARPGVAIAPESFAVDDVALLDPSTWTIA